MTPNTTTGKYNILNITTHPMPVDCELTPWSSPVGELMAGGVGHMGGLTNPCPWSGRCWAGYSNTGGPPLPRKRAPLQKKPVVLNWTEPEAWILRPIVEHLLPVARDQPWKGFPDKHKAEQVLGQGGQQSFLSPWRPGKVFVSEVHPIPGFQNLQRDLAAQSLWYHFSAMSDNF